MAVAYAAQPNFSNQESPRAMGCCNFFNCKQRHRKQVDITADESNEKLIAYAKTSPPKYRLDGQGKLLHPLTPGTVIHITGTPPISCSRFWVNLIGGKRDNEDIAFHLNPRLQQQYIVCNSRKNGVWGEEETATIKGYKLQRGERFQLDVLVGETEYFVTWNRWFVCKFPFRIPVHLVNAIEYDDSIDDLSVNLDACKSFGEDAVVHSVRVCVGNPSEDSFMDSLSAETDDVLYHEAPVTYAIPASSGNGTVGLAPNSRLIISGRVKLLPYSFRINLQAGSQRWPHPIIPMHLNSRFNCSNGEQVFIRNTWTTKCGWGQEQRARDVHYFQPGSKFTISIYNKQDMFNFFEVCVNGNMVAEYPFEDAKLVRAIDTVLIDGDVCISEVVLKTKSP